MEFLRINYHQWILLWILRCEGILFCDAFRLEIWFKESPYKFEARQDNGKWLCLVSAALVAENRRFVWKKPSDFRQLVIKGCKRQQKMTVWFISNRFCTKNRFLADSLPYEFIWASNFKKFRLTFTLNFRPQNELVWHFHQKAIPRTKLIRYGPKENFLRTDDWHPFIYSFQKLTNFPYKSTVLCSQSRVCSTWRYPIGLLDMGIFQNKTSTENASCALNIAKHEIPSHPSVYANRLMPKLCNSPWRT